MNELRRMAYLDALGVDAYVSRRQLPGAAETRRLAVARPGPGQPAPRTSPQPPSRPLAQGELPAAPVTPSVAPRAARVAGAAAPGADRTSASDALIPRFSLSTIVAGEWLWLEELGEMPLTVAQVQLVDAMARALSRASPSGAAPPGKPDTAQFDWPIHTNRQLALDEEASRAAVAGFVRRRLEQFGCAGLVLLGQACRARVPAAELDVQVVHTASTAEMLARPGLKPQVWRDLLPLLNAL